MSEIKLLPCPFCGGEVEGTFIADGRYNTIRCKTHNCILNVCVPNMYQSKEEVIKLWNTRKPMERIVERICNVRNNTPSTEFKNGCNASLHQIHRENDIDVKECGINE